MSTCLLKCALESCGREYHLEDGLRLYCDGEVTGAHGPALLRGQYACRQITVRDRLPGVFAYADWLPTNDYYFSLPDRPLGAPVSYRSVGLADRLGLANLFIAFSGYWPEKGAVLVTRSFKEFEAQASLARYLLAYRDQPTPPLIVASAGNTGNAYSYLASLLKLPLFLVVPDSALDTLVLPIETSARILAVRGDYVDAIEMAAQLQSSLAVQTDGGVRNLARRAGMGIVYLNAVLNARQGTGALFDHYFQAVGSGSGAIGTWEAVELLFQDGRFGRSRTRIHVAQNAPFTPIPDAWGQVSASTCVYSAQEARLRQAGVTASVLANGRPAYSIAGGLYDVLRLSGGEAWKVTNSELFDAARTFRDTEGVDAAPAGAVAIGALMKAVARGHVGRSDTILLHVTGGGVSRGAERMYRAAPVAIVAPGAVNEAAAALRDDAEPCVPSAALLRPQCQT
jgi:cysteate synthase